MKFDVSVVIPLYNAKKFIRACVDSVLNQTLKNVEVVIVDDCSTDDSLAYCRELYGNNDRVRIFQQPKNGGPGAARNRGVQEAEGEYIAFLDSDDEMMPFNLERIFTVAKQYDAAVRYIEQDRLDKWTHNKAIQKAIESYRVTDAHKAYLRTLRWK